MKCPGCAEDLQPDRLGPVGLDRCSACGGTWFEVGSLEQALREARGEIRRRFAPGPVLAPDPPAGDCPRCGTGARWIRVKSLENRAVTLAGCAVCHGRWLEEGALARLVAGEGVLGRMMAIFR